MHTHTGNGKDTQEGGPQGWPEVHVNTESVEFHKFSQHVTHRIVGSLERNIDVAPEVLQHSATLCKHSATLCNTLQHSANTLQHSATLCNTLQHSATLCNTLQRTHLWSCRSCFGFASRVLQHAASHCITLQHTATPPPPLCCCCFGFAHRFPLPLALPVCCVPPRKGVPWGF